MGKSPLSLAVKVSLRVALEEILKNYIFSIRFTRLMYSRPRLVSFRPGFNSKFPAPLIGESPPGATRSENGFGN